MIFEELDLSDLNSVRLFAKTFLEKYNRLDILINNAGLLKLVFGPLNKDILYLRYYGLSVC